MTNSTFFFDISRYFFKLTLSCRTSCNHSYLYNEEATTPFLNYYISYLSLAINLYIVFCILTGTRYSAILNL